VQQQLAAQQAQQAQQAELARLQQQVLGGQQPVQPLGGQGARLPVEQQQAQGTQALAQLAVQFPERFEQLNTNLGLIDQTRKEEAADFAFRLRNTPFNQREPLIAQRESSLGAQPGRDSRDTSSLRGLSEVEQNQALDTVQIAALSPEQRVDIAREGPAALQNIIEAAGGGFIGIDPRTRKSVFVPPPAGTRTEKQVQAEEKEQVKRVEQEVKDETTQFDRAQKLRSEISKVSTEFDKLNSAFGRIESSSADPSAAGDLALIFNFMKMLDPGSVVREGEFATAQNAAGIDTKIINQYNRLLTGERLAPKQRTDFLNQSRNIFERAQKDNVKAVDKIVDIGKQFGVSRGQLLGRRLEDFTPEDLSNLSDEELQALSAGDQ